MTKFESDYEQDVDDDITVPESGDMMRIIKDAVAKAKEEGLRVHDVPVTRPNSRIQGHPDNPLTGMGGALPDYEPHQVEGELEPPYRHTRHE